MLKKIAVLISLSISLLYAQDVKYNFKFATDAPDGSNWVTTFKEIDREIQVRTKKTVGLTIYPASLMGDQSSVVKKIRLGQLSGAGLSTSGAQLFYKDFGVLGFPMIFTRYEEYDYFLQKNGDFVSKELEKNGVVLLAFSEVGFIYLCSKKQVNSLDGVRKGKPILLEGDIISEALYKEIGAKPVPLQLADIMTSLQTGQVDTIFASPYALIATQWFTKVSYIADFPIGLMVGAIVIDKKQFDQLSKEHQAIMKELFKTNFDKLTLKVRLDNENARKSLIKYGIKFLPISASEQKNFNDIRFRAYNRLTEKEYSKSVLEMVLKTVSEYSKQ
jgi:TRAP-type C4-dicarboxylate transport system substrate-binding protein